MTLTYQAEDVFSFVWGRFNDSHCGVELGKPLNRLSQCPRMLSAKVCVSVSLFSPTATHYLNVLHFRPEKAASGHLKPKGPELGVAIITLRWANVSVIMKY